MTAPHVTELPLRLEPVSPDPFLFEPEQADPPRVDPKPDDTPEARRDRAARTA
jgi:hypothetical protein